MKNKERGLTLDDESDHSSTMPVMFYLFLYGGPAVTVMGAGGLRSLGKYEVRFSIAAGFYSNKRLLVLDLG